MILRVATDHAGGLEPPRGRGLIRAHLGRDRRSGQPIEVTVWDDLDAALGTDTSAADPAYFDVGSTWLEWSRDEPVVFRLAVGRLLRPRADLEMLAWLRDRVPMIGEDMTESAVGRRVVGRAVEILFFSAWAREPAAWRLDEPFWPDIARQCDAFSVRVCESIRPIVSRPPRP